MTNRTKYTLFTKFDDPEIEKSLDKNENIIIFIGGETLLLKRRVNTLGTFWSLFFIQDENREIYGRYLTQDCWNVEEFLKLVKDHLER